jgi:N utilization substance protein A
VQRVSIVDDGGRVMEVVVEDKQLSLAIGKKGQNVRLAAKLTGWRIDIKSEEEKRREVEAQFGALELGDGELGEDAGAEGAPTAGDVADGSAADGGADDGALDAAATDDQVGEQVEGGIEPADGEQAAAADVEPAARDEQA